MCNKIISKGILAVVAVSVLLSGMVLGCKQASGGGDDDTPIETINFVKMADNYYQFKTNDSKYYNKYFAVTDSNTTLATNSVAIKCKKVSGDVNCPLGMVCFRGTDWTNLYVVVITPAGNYAIYKKINGSWVDQAVVSLKPSDAINKGLGVENKISVVPLGSNSYQLKINNSDICTFTNTEATCPADGYCGFYAEISSAQNEQFPGTPEDMRFINASN
jgi:hypothetical protein